MVVMACVVAMLLVIVVIVVTFVVVVILMVFMIPVVMIIVVVMVMAFMVVMILVAMIIMVVLVAMLVVLFVVAMTMDLAVEMFGLTPHQSGTDRRLDREAAAIAKAPLEHAAKQTIEGVMPWIVLKIVIESGMPLNCDDRREIKFPFFHAVGTTSTVAAVGKGSWCMDQREQKQSQ
jgi:energy-coupling factor transporter transmembrane protein EcfT